MILRFLSIFGTLLSLAACNGGGSSTNASCSPNATVSIDYEAEADTTQEGQNVLIAEAARNEKQTHTITLASGTQYKTNEDSGSESDDDSKTKIDFKKSLITFIGNNVEMGFVENKTLTQEYGLPAYSINPEQIKAEFEKQIATANQENPDVKMCGVRSVSMSFIVDKTNKKILLLNATLINVFLKEEIVASIEASK